jgi:hypothetical protein
MQHQYSTFSECAQLRAKAWYERLLSARSLANAALSERILQIHAASDEIFGMPKIHAEPADDHAIFVSPKPRGQAHACRVDRSIKFAFNYPGQFMNEKPIPM